MFNELFKSQQRMDRRKFFTKSSLGIGALALGNLLKAESVASPLAGIPGLPHFAPRAKRIVFLF
ncbi:MAG: sulfatase, partial [Bacteroidota bacterium]